MEAIVARRRPGSTCGIDISLHEIDLRRGGRWVLRGLSLRLDAGRRYALIGENGAGKTQLLKLLATDVWPTPSGRESVSFAEGGRTLDPAEAKRRIAYLGAERQDRYARYGWNLRVGDLVATGLHGSDLLLRESSSAELRRVARMLRAAGLLTLAGRRFLSLSYGQKRLALLARALIGEPDWLLLDEFYNGLDGRFRRRIDRLLAAARARGQSWVAAAHREADVPRGTRELLQLRGGRIALQGALEDAEFARLARDAREGDAREGDTAQPPRAGLRSRRRPAGAGEALLRIRGADLYVDYRRVLRDVNWELRRGEHWAVVGANGAGKSSFLKLLYGDLAPALGGLIERQGCPAGTPIEAWKRGVGYVSPELQCDYDADVDLRELVASGGRASIGLAEPVNAAELRAAERALALFGLASAARRRPRELSYGQLRRALLARALAHRPRLLLLDEPLTGLDPRQRAMVKRSLENLGRSRLTMVIAVHHREDLPACVTRTLRLEALRAHVAD